MNQITQLEKLIKIQELIGKADAKIVVIQNSKYYNIFGGDGERIDDIKTAQEVIERIESYYNTKLLELYQSRVQELIPTELQSI